MCGTSIRGSSGGLYPTPSNQHALLTQRLIAKRPPHRRTPGGDGAGSRQLGDLSLVLLDLAFSVGQIHILGEFGVGPWHHFDFVALFHAVVVEPLGARATVATLGAPEL